MKNKCYAERKMSNNICNSWKINLLSAKANQPLNLSLCLREWRLWLCLLLLGTAISVSGAPLEGDARPPRSIRIGAETMLEIPFGQAGGTEIVLSPTAAIMTRFAAVELQQLLSRKLGYEPPIVEQPSAEKCSFVLGLNEYSQAAGIDAESLCRDAFIIRTVGNNIHILGRDDAQYDQFAAVKRASGWQFHYEKGTLFGVYDFLERFAEARFFFYDQGTIVPPGPLQIPSIDIYDRPDFEVRQVQIYQGKHFESENGVLARNMDYLRRRFGTQYVPCCHGLGGLGYFQRFGQSHPEYFALDSTGARVNAPRRDVWHAHFCYTSAVKEEIYQDARSCLLNEPASKRGIITPYDKVGWDPTAQAPGSVFCAMPGDSFFRCQCDNCRPYMQDERSISDFYWGFVFDLAERLQREGIPGLVTNMSYPPYRLIPSNRSMPANVYVMTATRGPWNERYPELQAADTARIRDWVEYGQRKTWLWNYANKFGSCDFPGIPHTTPKAVGKYYQDVAPLIFGAFLESETDCYQFNFLNYYVFSKVAWDNRCDVNAVLQDYYQRLFGAAAQPLRQFFERLEYLWLEKVLKEPVVTELGPSSVTASTHECWKDIYSKTEREALTELFQQAETLAANTPDELSRVKLFRELFLQPMLQQGGMYEQQTDVVANFQTRARVLEPGEAPVLDGRLEEKIWQDSGIYLQNLESAGNDSSRVMIAVDASHLYLGCIFSEPDMAAVLAPERKAGDPDIWRDNGWEVFLNPDCTRKNYYQLIMNSAGQLRAFYYAQVGLSRPASKVWDSGARYAVTLGESSWQGELAIPWSALGVSDPERMVANFTRNQVRRGYPEQRYSWSPFLNRSLVAPYHDCDNFGTVECTVEKSSNLVQDGDFSDLRRESIFWGKWWSKADAGSISYDENSFISGFRSLCLSSSGKTVAMRQALPGLVAGRKYRVSYFVRLENVQPKGQFPGVVLNVMDDHNRWFPKKWLSGDVAWTYQSAEFTAGPGTNQGKLQSYMILYLFDSSGKAWFDDIKIVEIQ